jgi:hypothetical protein
MVDAAFVSLVGGVNSFKLLKKFFGPLPMLNVVRAREKVLTDGSYFFRLDSSSK